MARTEEIISFVTAAAGAIARSRPRSPCIPLRTLIIARFLAVRAAYSSDQVRKRRSKSSKSLSLTE